MSGEGDVDLARDGVGSGRNRGGGCGALGKWSLLSDLLIQTIGKINNMLLCMMIILISDSEKKK